MFPCQFLGGNFVDTLGPPHGNLQGNIQFRQTNVLFRQMNIQFRLTNLKFRLKTVAEHWTF